MKHKVLVNQKCQSVVRGHDFFNGKMKRILEQNREVATVADLHHLVDAMCKTLDMTLAFKVLLFFPFSLYSYPYFSDKERQDYIGKEILGSWCSHAVLSDSDGGYPKSLDQNVGVLKLWVRIENVVPFLAICTKFLLIGV